MAYEPLTEEQREIRDLVRQLARERIAPRAAEIDESHEFPWDVVESRLFYETVAPTVGLHVFDGDPGRFHVVGETRSFALVEDDPPSENVHLAFPAPDRATVNAFHRAGTEAGFRDNGEPGERPYHPGYYGAFVLDPDGNNIEVVFHDRD